MNEKRNGALDRYPIEKKRAGRPSVTVKEDGAVIFYLYAPAAKIVQVAGLGGYFTNKKINLMPDGQGGFFAEVQDFHWGMHYYFWYVDGVRICNPYAGISYGCFAAINTFEVQEKNVDFYFAKDIPHGTVSICKYASKVSSHLKECYVYTPYGYEEGDERYPVLYLQHGVGENETGWIWQGKTNFIMDYLIAEGKCEKMIVVMSSGYAFKDGEKPVFYPGNFESELIHNIIPYIENNFRVRKGRDYRAMAGLSLGSAQTTDIVAKNMKLFSAAGVFSGVAIHEMERICDSKETLDVVFMSCGCYEDQIRTGMKQIEQKFENAGKYCISKVYEGYHEWHVWRKSLYDFVPLLFRKAGAETDDIPGERTARITRQRLQRQTMEEQILMFDPVYRQIRFETDEAGRPAGKYPDIPHGICITEQGTAVVCFEAPEAVSVEATLDGKEFLKLRKDQERQGYWTGEIHNITPGYHNVYFRANGTDVINPDAPVGYSGDRAVNYLEMPEEDFEEYRIRQVPHGTVHYEYYKSNSTGRTKLCYVYTPAGYEEHLEKRYPVLYLQHGGGENEVGWIWQGKLANIADNLIAKGQMKEMIVVMNTGYAFPENGEYHHSMSAFLQELPESCVPYIDSRYRTIADKDYRALAGLSMGGMQTQRIVFTYPELFGWAGIFSGGLVIRDDEVDYTEVLLNPEAFRKQFHMLFVACGKQEWSYESTVKNEKEVLAAGVPIEVFEGYGYHDWTFWRHCLNAFLRKLF